MRLCKVGRCERNAEFRCDDCGKTFCDEHAPKRNVKGWRYHCGQPLGDVDSVMWTPPKETKS